MFGGSLSLFPAPQGTMQVLGQGQSLLGQPQQAVPNLGLTTPSQLGGLNFGQPQTIGLTLGQPASIASSFAPQQQQQLQQTAPRGLGGEGIPGGENSSVTKSSKDTTTLPPEWLSLVENFKKFVKEQKTIKEENSQPRFSSQPILEIASDLDENLRTKLQKMDVVLQKNSKAVEILKKETNQLICDAETAYRTVRSDGWNASSAAYNVQQNQYMVPSSHKYFVKLMSEFENQMEVYSSQIKELEAHMENMNKPLVPQELLNVVKRQHETLVALAAEIYAIHEKINKDSYKSGATAPKSVVPMFKGASSPMFNESGPQKESTLGPNPFSTPTATDRFTAALNPQPSSAQPTSLFSSPQVSFSSPWSMSSFSASTPQNKAKRFN